MANVANMADTGYRHVVGDAASVAESPKVNPYAETPVYRQLAGILRERIESGEFDNLAALPSEKQLGETYEVGRDTVRAAIAVLRDAGLVFTVPHRGTFVGRRPE